MGLELLIAFAAAVAAPQNCQAALGNLFDGPDPRNLPNQVDGAALTNARSLVELRAGRGDDLLIVHGGGFAGEDLRGANLHNICFIGSDFSGSDWRGAEASGSGFVGANLEGAQLAGAKLDHVLLRNVNLNDVDAQGAVLAGGRFDGGWFDGSVEGLRLDRADLSGFRFECGITLDDGCPVYSGGPPISLRGANLGGANLWGSADLTGARIDRTEAGLGDLFDLQGAELAGPILLRGGEAVAALSPEDYRALLPRIRRPEEAPAPSFDCARAATPVEREICGENGASLRDIDVSVARLYRRAVALDPSVERSQLRWLRERDLCLTERQQDSWCLQSAYERRREALVARLGPPDWARPGAIALFVGPVIEFDPAFHSEPLYQRLLPVLIGAAWSRAVVRVNGDGSIDARGDAIGANAHLCSLEGDGLRLDRSNGWYSGPYQATADDPAEWRDRPMPVLLFWDDRAQVYQHGRPFAGDSGDPRFSDYASCGMRASFGNLLRVPVSDEEARRIFDSYAEEE